jgi:AraC family transcriptional regulator of adaptative response/methylated-DNA-[protein]-cysteine methyltransferase
MKTDRFAIGTCSLGSILVAASELGICALLLGDSPPRLVRELRARFPDARPPGGDALAPLLAAAVALVEDPARGFDAPLDPRGTPFQMRVWHALRDIPAGETASYGEIARRIGAPGAAIEVGLACASNTIAVAIPCHRVVKKDGGLAGYRWGVVRKRALLEREAFAGASQCRQLHEASAGASQCRQLHEASAAASPPRQLSLLPGERGISA